MRRSLTASAFVILLLGTGCGSGGGAAGQRTAAAAATGTKAPAAASSQRCAPDNGGITLPAGFCASIFADSVGRARHLVVAPNGDVFVALSAGPDSTSGGVLALRDTTGDGHADVRVHWPQSGGTGIALANGYLYFAPDNAVLRYPYKPGSLEPGGPPDTIVEDLPTHPGHHTKSIAVLGDSLFVDIGSPSNSCQVKDRTAGSPGIDPCPQLATRAGIWLFNSGTPHQTEADGQRFATGIRNAPGIAINPQNQDLYAVQMGRDQLYQNWSKYYNAKQGAELPAEVFLRVLKDTNFGWPYCYYDQFRRESVLAPEYGGNGQKIGRCGRVGRPVMAFPGHWAPLSLLFYQGTAFPARYRGGAFIAFHGSWNRAPLPQEGYDVVFVPMEDGFPSDSFAVFANGFAGPVKQPGSALHRPAGVAEGPHGALYISDDKGGRIWRVVYTGGAH